MRNLPTFHIVQILTNAIRVNLKLTIDLRYYTLEVKDLDIFDSISLDEMNSVSLMKRKDTKFLLHKDTLNSVLNTIKSDYKILQVANDRLMTYNSIYFDTDSDYFYHMHHNGISHRIKVRIRNYVESDLCFLEVKQKDSQGNTVKNRIKVDTLSSTLDNEANEFIAKTTSQNIDLKKSIENKFNRFTLVHTEIKERVTVDINLSYNGTIFNKDLVIIELKQPRLNRQSPVFQALKKRSTNPYSISKYCIGMAQTNPELKQNIFKPKFLKINKLTA